MYTTEWSNFMRLAVAQIISSADLAGNLDLIRDYATRAKAAGAELVVFPEAAMRSFGNTLADIAEPLDGPWAGSVQEIAKTLDIAIVAGMFTPGQGGRVRNTLLVTGPGIDTSYDKIHLFDAFGFAESDSVDAGTSPVTFELNGTVMGLATCYDVRFPALFTANARAGAQVNIVCASWGAGDGKAEQWDLLVRARALDSTTFVVACGQGDPASAGLPSAGTAPTGIGHSAVISPLGSAVVALGGEPELAVVDIDPSLVAGVREKLPVLANARSFQPQASGT
jgi:predicted amidohydrolase